MCQKIIKGTISIMPKLCIDCKYYKNAFFKSNKYGKCTKVFSIDLVDGTRFYNYASSIRTLECREQYFEPIEKSTLIQKISNLFLPF